MKKILIFALFLLISNIYAQKNQPDNLKTEELPEVVVNSKKKKMSLGFHKKKTKYSVQNHIIFSKYALFIQNPNIEKSHLITKIYIPIYRGGKTTTGICHIQLYKKSLFGTPDSSFLQKTISVNIDTLKGNLIKIDIKDQNLFLPKEGIFVGMEWPNQGGRPEKITSEKQLQGPGFSYVFTTTEKLTWWSDIRTGYKWRLMDRAVDFTDDYYNKVSVINKKKNHPNINYGIEVETF